MKGVNQGPKRKTNLNYFKVTKDEDEMDINNLLSFVFAFIGMIFKYKWAIWISFFLFLSSFLN